MTSTSQAIREMVKETCATIKKHAADYHQLESMQTSIDSLSDNDLIARANSVLSPHANSIRSKDLNVLDGVFPDLKLAELANLLPSDVVDKIWGDVGMLVMLLATVSLVPPDMLKQIEGFANAMASSMQSGGSGGDLGMNLGAMFGNAFANVGDDPTPNARARRQRPRNKPKQGSGQMTAQEKFRRNLV